MSSFLPLSILRSCFVPSIQLAPISFSNPPCFRSWSFRSSILPLLTLLFSAWLTLPSCFFLLVLVWGASHCCCSHFLFHLDFSAQFLFLVCLVDQLWRRLIFFVIELINAKGGFSCGKKKNKSNNGTQGFAQLRVRCVTRVLTGRGGALN